MGRPYSLDTSLVVLTLTILAAVCNASKVPGNLHSSQYAARIIQFGAPAQSHWLQHGPISLELAARGHQVMLLSSSEDTPHLQRLGLSNHPNISITTYPAPFPFEKLRESVRGSHGLKGVIQGSKLVQEYSDAVFTDAAALQKLQDFNADLLFGDIAVPTGYAVADKLGIPKGVLFVAGLVPPLDAPYGITVTKSLARVPQMNSGLSSTMSFLQRVQNTVIWATSDLIVQALIQPVFSKTWIKNGIPPHSFRASVRNVSIVVVADDFAVSPARPISPHVTLVGSLTAAPAKPLESELLSFVESAGSHGVVFASFGTTAIPQPHELEAVSAALTLVAPIKAIWKLAEADQELLRSLGISPGPNVRVVAWAPQNDLLGHPNLRAFLTQGGTNSFLEAMFHGMPIVGLPLFGEQPGNIAKAVLAGAGISVSPDDRRNMARNLEEALRKLINDPSYKQAAVEVSKRMRAHRRTPVQLAADAIEHAAWTKGSLYLRAGRNPLAWYQECLLDVLAFFAVAAVLILGLLYAILAAIWRLGKRIMAKAPAKRKEA